MKKSRLVDKTKRLLPSTDTPRGAAPEGAERAPEDQYTTAARKSQARRANFPPAASQGRGEHRIGCDAASAAPPRRGLALTGGGQWESGGGGAHTFRVDPG